MKRILTVLASLALALTGLFVMAPVAQANHVFYCSVPGQTEFSASDFGVGAKVCGIPEYNYEGAGNYGYEVRVSDDQADGFCAHLYRNASWVNDGWVELAVACGNGTLVKYRTRYDPPCGDGDQGTVTFKWVGWNQYSHYIDPPDCT